MNPPCKIIIGYKLIICLKNHAEKHYKKSAFIDWPFRLFFAWGIGIVLNLAWGGPMSVAPIGAARSLSTC